MWVAFERCTMQLDGFRENRETEVGSVNVGYSMKTEEHLFYITKLVYNLLDFPSRYIVYCADFVFVQWRESLKWKKLLRRMESFYKKTCILNNK